jgi:hypothetical protein
MDEGRIPREVRAREGKSVLEWWRRILVKAILEYVVAVGNFLLAVGVAVWVLRWVFRRTRKRATGSRGVRDAGTWWWG